MVCGVALASAFLMPLPSPALAISNAAVRVELDAGTGCLSVGDLRTGRTWRSFVAGSTVGPVSAAKATTGKMIYTVAGPRGAGMSLRTLVALDGDKPEFTVSVSATNACIREFGYPFPFESCRGDRLVVALNEGMAFPVEESEPDGGCGGHGVGAYSGTLSMPFYGLIADGDGAGLMTIIETRNDAVLDYQRNREGLLSARTLWKPRKGCLGYNRRLRHVLIGIGGGHVAMAKRYRAWAKEHGLFKPFSEKVNERPNVDRLLGAVNFWFWTGDGKMALEMVKRLDDCGIRRVLWSHDTSPEAVKALAARPDTLVGKYDIYTDVYYPEVMEALGRKGQKGLNGEAWPDDISWASPDSNDWRKAWGPKLKDGTIKPTARMCDACAPKYMRQRISEELKTKPFTSRFIDVTATHEWTECWNPAHPMTRTDNRRANHECLELVGREFGLVVGSETANDAFADVIDYSEGTLSISPYRVPRSGRDVEVIWNEAPEKTAKYQVGESYRIPLWELVYHDSVCAHWYWGDYQNKLPELWSKRDLFNVLYGTMPMFLVRSVEDFDRDRERFVRSYRMTSPVARATGYSEMVGHRYLSSDKSVQRTDFSNGVSVTVDFRQKSVLIEGLEKGVVKW